MPSGRVGSRESAAVIAPSLRTVKICRSWPLQLHILRLTKIKISGGFDDHRPLSERRRVDVVFVSRDRIDQVLCPIDMTIAVDLVLE